MKKTCLLSGNFALDTIVMREYPNGFTLGKNNKFIENVVSESVGNTCGNVSCMLSYLGINAYPIAHFDLTDQGKQLTDNLKHYGCDVRFVDNSDKGGTTLMRCTHKRDKNTGEHATTFRATSPGSRFPKRRYLRMRDEAPVFIEKLDFTPDVFFYDASEAGLRYLAGELRKRGTLVYFEPESDADHKKFIKGVEVSDIVKFSHEKVTDKSFTDSYSDKLFIRTMGAEGLEFNLRGQGWHKVAAVPNDNVVDWEGAGDWTTSQFIASLCERDILSVAQMTVDNVRECLEIACQTASCSVSYLASKGMIDNVYMIDTLKKLLDKVTDEEHLFDSETGEYDIYSVAQNFIYYMDEAYETLDEERLVEYLLEAFRHKEYLPDFIPLNVFPDCFMLCKRISEKDENLGKLYLAKVNTQYVFDQLESLEDEEPEHIIESAEITLRKLLPFDKDYTYAKELHNTLMEYAVFYHKFGAEIDVLRKYFEALDICRTFDDKEKLTLTIFRLAEQEIKLGLIDRAIKHYEELFEIGINNIPLYKRYVWGFLIQTKSAISEKITDKQEAILDGLITALQSII